MNFGAVIVVEMVRAVVVTRKDSLVVQTTMPLSPQLIWENPLWIVKKSEGKLKFLKRSGTEFQTTLLAEMLTHHRLE